MVQQVFRTIPEGQRDHSACRHFWIIDPPTDRVSQGICRLCGDVRQFKNFIESAPWGEDASPAAATMKLTHTPSEDDEDAEEL